MRSPSLTIRVRAATVGGAARPTETTVVSDGFDWQGATYPSLSAIARAITGTAWSGPRFFALTARNGTPTRSNNKKSVRAGGDRNGWQPAPGMNIAALPCKQPRMRKT